MDAATNLLPGEFGKPALDLIDPRGRCWREVHMIVRSARQPGFDHSRFVSGVIVHDDMDVETLGNARRFASRNPGTGRRDVVCSICRSQSRTRRRGPRTAMLCRGGHKSEFGAPGRPASWAGPAARDQGLVSGSFRQRSAPAPDWRRQIKTDDIADLVDEQRVIGKLERLRAMDAAASRKRSKSSGSSYAKTRSLLPWSGSTSAWHPLAWTEAC